MLALSLRHEEPAWKSVSLASCKGLKKLRAPPLLLTSFALLRLLPWPLIGARRRLCWWRRWTKRLHYAVAVLATCAWVRSMVNARQILILAIPRTKSVRLILLGKPLSNRPGLGRLGRTRQRQPKRSMSAPLSLPRRRSTPSRPARLGW